MKYLLLIIGLSLSVQIVGQTLLQTTNSSSSLLLGNNIKEDYFNKTTDSTKIGNLILLKSGKKTKNKDYFKGKFKYLLPRQTSINVATKDKKLTVENLYNFQHKNGNKYFVLGLNATAKINNSIASVFNNNDVVGGFSGSVLLGIKLFNIKNKKEIVNFFINNIDSMGKSEIKAKIGTLGQIEGHWFYINPSIEGRKFKRYFPDNEFDSQIEKKNESLWSINIGYNYWTPNILGFNAIFGTSLTPKFSDNFSNLSEFSLTEKQLFTNDIIQRTSTSKTTVYKGDYKTSHKQDLNFEAFLVPNKLPTFGLYMGYLTTYEKDFKNQSTFSTGIFFSEPKEPTNPSLGIVVNFKDISNNFKLESSEKFSVNLVTKINIGKTFK